MSPWPQIQGPKTTRHLGQLRALAGAMSRHPLAHTARAWSFEGKTRGGDDDGDRAELPGCYDPERDPRPGAGAYEATKDAAARCVADSGGRPDDRRLAPPALHFEELTNDVRHPHHLDVYHHLYRR